MYGKNVYCCDCIYMERYKSEDGISPQRGGYRCNYYSQKNGTDYFVSPNTIRDCDGYNLGITDKIKQRLDINK